METKDLANTGVNDLFEKISALIEESRKKVAKAVNIAEVYTKYEIGRYIVENEQEGKYRAGYGKQILQQLSVRLTDKFGKGWSIESLTLVRKFYSVFSNSVNTVYEISKSNKSANNPKIVNTVDQIQNAAIQPHKFVLSWSHYLILMRIENADARSFYEVECAKQNWRTPSSTRCRHLCWRWAKASFSSRVRKGLP